MKISLDEILSNHDRWENTSYFRPDGKIEYRERKEYGNGHAVFDNENSLWGELHTDKFNALNFPIGTIRHIGQYVEEKTGIPEKVTSSGIGVAVAVLAIIVCYKTFK